MQALQMLLDRLNSGNIPINSEMITRSSTEGATNIHRSTTGTAPTQGVSQASVVTCTTCIIQFLLIFCVFLLCVCEFHVCARRCMAEVTYCDVRTQRSLTLSGA